MVNFICKTKIITKKFDFISINLDLPSTYIKTVRILHRIVSLSLQNKTCENLETSFVS